MGLRLRLKFNSTAAFAIFHILHYIHALITGITESSTDPPTHRPYHRPTWSVMRSVSDGQWVGVLEGALLQGRLAASG